MAQDAEDLKMPDSCENGAGIQHSLGSLNLLTSENVAARDDFEAAYSEVARINWVAGEARARILRRPSASPPLRGYVPPAALDDKSSSAAMARRCWK